MVHAPTSGDVVKVARIDSMGGYARRPPRRRLIRGPAAAGPRRSGPGGRPAGATSQCAGIAGPTCRRPARPRRRPRRAARPGAGPAARRDAGVRAADQLLVQHLAARAADHPPAQLRPQRQRPLPQLQHEVAEPAVHAGVGRAEDRRPQGEPARRPRGCGAAPASGCARRAPGRGWRRASAARRRPGRGGRRPCGAAARGRTPAAPAPARRRRLPRMSQPAAGTPGRGRPLGPEDRPVEGDPMTPRTAVTAVPHRRRRRGADLGGPARRHVRQVRAARPPSWACRSSGRSTARCSSSTSPSPC